MAEFVVVDIYYKDRRALLGKRAVFQIQCRGAHQKGRGAATRYHTRYNAIYDFKFPEQTKDKH
jgi:hypothetical protein